MRSGRRLYLLAAVTALGVAACAAPVALGTDVPAGSTPDAPPADPAERAAPVAHTGGIALCTVLPTRVVGDLVGAGAPFDASGAGAQCTWRGAGPDDDAPVVQAVMLDASAYHAGRPHPQDPSVASVADVAGVGDEAFVVRLGEGAPTTLYVRDGQRALSLWLDDVPLTPQATERSLARMASLLLNLA